MATFVTLLDMSPQRCGSTPLDRAHDAALPATEGIRVFLTVGRPGLAEDIRHLKPGGAQRQSQK